MYLGDVNATIDNHFIPLSAALEQNHEISSPGWEMENGQYIITIAGYSIDFKKDKRNENIQPFMIKFNMGAEMKKGMFPILYPKNDPTFPYNMVQIGYLEQSRMWPEAWIMGGGIQGAKLYLTKDSNQTSTVNLIFGVMVPHAD